MATYQSCDPRGLYEFGGFSGSRDEYEALLPLGNAGEFIFELYGKYEYLRPNAAQGGIDSPYFAYELEKLYTHINSAARNGAPCRVYRLKNAILNKRVITIDHHNELRVVYETHRPQDRAELLLDPSDVTLAAPRWGDPSCAYLFLGSVGSFNYGHWIVDDLPRLAAVHGLRKALGKKPIRIIMSGHDLTMDAIRRQSIETVLGNVENVQIIFVPDRQPLRFDEIYFASPVTTHPVLKSPAALHWLRRQVLSRTGGLRFGLKFDRVMDDVRRGRLPRARQRKLFVERGPSRTRGLMNVEEVFAALAPMGFERILVDSTSFALQVAAFADADIVVGVMGAAMTNAIFCNSATSVVHLAPEGWSEPFYWDLAAVMRQQYGAIYGRSEGDPFVDGFQVDVNEVIRFISQSI